VLARVPNHLTLTLPTRWKCLFGIKKKEKSKKKLEKGKAVEARHGNAEQILRDLLTTVHLTL
jgi:hypothetical protein